MQLFDRLPDQRQHLFINHIRLFIQDAYLQRFRLSLTAHNKQNVTHVCELFPLSPDYPLCTLFFYP